MRDIINNLVLNIVARLLTSAIFQPLKRNFAHLIASGSMKLHRLRLDSMPLEEFG